MPTPDENTTKYLPKEHLDLPVPNKALPSGNKNESTHNEDKRSDEVGVYGQESEVKTLLSWHAASRPFRRRESEYYLNILVITLALMVILFLFSQYMLMLLALSLVFLNYALTTVAPHDFRYKITNQGITVEDHFYYWDELYDFYFKMVDGEQTIYVTTRYYLHSILVLNLGVMHREQVQSVLLKYIPFREIVRPSSLEKAGEWLSKTFPLEKRPI